MHLWPHASMARKCRRGGLPVPEHEQPCAGAAAGRRRRPSARLPGRHVPGPAQDAGRHVRLAGAACPACAAGCAPQGLGLVCPCCVYWPLAQLSSTTLELPSIWYGAGALRRGSHLRRHPAVEEDAGLAHDAGGAGAGERAAHRQALRQHHAGAQRHAMHVDCSLNDANSGLRSFDSTSTMRCVAYAARLVTDKG